MLRANLNQNLVVDVSHLKIKTMLKLKQAINLIMEHNTPNIPTQYNNQYLIVNHQIRLMILSSGDCELDEKHNRYKDMKIAVTF